MSTPSSVLNDALIAYISTFPSIEKLKDFLQSHNLMASASEIEKALKSVISSADEFLWAQAGGVKWSPEFEANYFKHLSGLHPWLSEAGFKPILSYSGWLCWHEGLNA